MPDAVDPVAIVLDYLAAAQRARSTHAAEDLERVKGFLAPGLSVRLASPWTHSPWRVVLTSADELVHRLTAPINRGSNLTTTTVNAVRAGEDVLVEQVTTLRWEGREHVSMVCHLFSLDGGRISAIRTYRNDNGLPAG